MKLNPFSWKGTPAQRILNAAECEALEKRLAINVSQLPKMMETDACARWLGAVRGDVIEVTFTMRSVGKRVEYRLVAEAAT